MQLAGAIPFVSQCVRAHWQQVGFFLRTCGLTAYELPTYVRYHTIHQGSGLVT